MSASSPTKTIIAFDLYGTILDTSSIVHHLAEHVGDCLAATIASQWRQLQLEYTWRLNSMGIYRSFSSVNASALRAALASTTPATALSATTLSSLLTAYNTLRTFPDVLPSLGPLVASTNITPVIFSNGTAEMLNASVKLSPDLGPHAATFREIVSVEGCRKFKPHGETYKWLAEVVGARQVQGEETGKEGKLDGMWLVSGNPFDIVGAKVAGLRTCWVDRGGRGWTDEVLGEGLGRPDLIVRGFGEVQVSVERMVMGRG